MRLKQYKFAKTKVIVPQVFDEVFLQLHMGVLVSDLSMRFNIFFKCAMSSTMFRLHIVTTISLSTRFHRPCACVLLQQPALSLQNNCMQNKDIVQFAKNGIFWKGPVPMCAWLLLKPTTHIPVTENLVRPLFTSEKYKEFYPRIRPGGISYSAHVLFLSPIMGIVWIRRTVL